MPAYVSANCTASSGKSLSPAVSHSRLWPFSVFSGSSTLQTCLWLPVSVPHSLPAPLCPQEVSPSCSFPESNFCCPTHFFWKILPWQSSSKSLLPGSAYWHWHLPHPLRTWASALLRGKVLPSPAGGFEAFPHVTEGCKAPLRGLCHAPEQAGAEWPVATHAWCHCSCPAAQRGVSAAGPSSDLPREERLYGHKSIVFSVLPCLLVKRAATDRSHPAVSVPLLPCSCDCFSPCLCAFFSGSLALTCIQAELAEQACSPRTCLTGALVSLQALLYVAPCLGQGQLYSQLSLQQRLFSLSTWSESRVQKIHGGF